MPPEAKGPVLEGCLWQQCNQSTKELLRSVPPGVSLAMIIKHVVKEENLAPVQTAVNAAVAPLPAAVGAAVAQVMATQNHHSHHRPSPTNLPFLRPRGPCWICGRKGHNARHCAQGRKQGNGRGRGQAGRMQLPPHWNSQWPKYAGPTGAEHFPIPLPPGEVTSFTSQVPLPQTPVLQATTASTKEEYNQSQHNPSAVP